MSIENLEKLAERANEVLAGIKAKIAKLKESEIKKPEPWALHTMVNCGNLEIGFYDDADDFQELGDIAVSGFCRILSYEDRQDNWQAWKDNGMLVCSDAVEWKGKEYFITGNFVLKSGRGDGLMYDFEHCIPCTGCKDENIQRFSNGTPKIL